MSKIYAGKTISYFESGAQYLVLWVSLNNEYGYWYDLNSRSQKTPKLILGDIIADESSGKCEISDFLPPAIRTEESLTDAERLHRDRLWEMMRHAVESEPEIYEPNMRIAILRSIAYEHGIKPNNLYSLLDKYWRFGRTKNAFIPRYSNSGAKGKARSAYSNDDGRNNSSPESVGKTLTDHDRNNFATATKKYYLTRNKVSFATVYERLLQDFYSVESKGGSEKIKLLPPSELPTLRQFKYWYYKNRDIITEHKKRDGESSFELTGRSVLGRADFGLMGPGAQFQIDATVGDIYLVSQFDRSNIIGRPVLYFVIDAFSRMVAGLSVALEGPSWRGMAGAISNMAADKVAFCSEYGIEISENDWPCKHIPSSLVGDRGELISKNADNLVNVLGMRIVNTPPYRADLKGIVEQHFRTINTNSVALLPGSVKPDMSKRGGRDYRLDAKLDIRQFTQIVIKCVLHYNNHHYMEYFERNEAMMSDKVSAIPINLWNWGIGHYSGAPRSLSEDVVRFAVMPTDKATVTGKGIRFKGLFYSSDKAVDEGWFEKARSKGTWAIPISYDYRDMANIYVWNEERKTYDTCTLLDWNGKNAGKCLDEIIYEQQSEKVAAKQLKTSEIEAKINLNADIDAIVSEAQNMSRTLPSKSKREKVSKIRENRRNEREALEVAKPVNNTTKTFADTKKTNAYIADNTADDEISPTLRMIKQKMEERQKND